MKYLILAMLFAIPQAAPPAPREASDSPAATGSTIQQKSGQENKQTNNKQALPTTKATSVGNQPTENHQAAGKQQADNNEEHPIRIGEFPPVSVRKDWGDWGIWIFDFLLVVVGFLQVLLLIRHAGHLDKLATAAQASVVAAQANAEAAAHYAEALIKSDRPWIIVNIDAVDRNSGIYRVVAINTGKTPAEMADGYCEKSVNSEQFVPPDKLTTPFIAPAQTLTVPRDSFEVDRINVPSYSISPNMLFCYGKIEYWDIFTDRSKPTAKPHVTQWCMVYEPSRKFWYRAANGYGRNT